jgi:hypothetical protein
VNCDLGSSQPRRLDREIDTVRSGGGGDPSVTVPPGIAALCPGQPKRRAIPFEKPPSAGQRLHNILQHPDRKAHRSRPSSLVACGDDFATFDGHGLVIYGPSGAREAPSAAWPSAAWGKRPRAVHLRV